MLRSVRSLHGCVIRAFDGDIGSVNQVYFDDEAWAIRYPIVDTHNWWPGGKEVLIATDWIHTVDWFASTVSTSLTREVIQHSPLYDKSVPIHRSYEVALHQFYGKHGYWSNARIRR
ncbi:hypothetical protein [Paraburkholderia sp. GAS334]|jgi:hypothetical protein|uniref:hypothetical protein n=1 Tax=unclassified Paraburkholderia TaxID=2615204 RepID=UPI003D214625